MPLSFAPLHPHPLTSPSIIENQILHFYASISLLPVVSLQWKLETTSFVFFFACFDIRFLDK